MQQTNDVLNALDLNLLRTLSVVLEERSVTRAARRLGRSQPAVSHALARLRDVFADPLLVREGSSMVATPRAEALREPLGKLLAELAELLVGGPVFDPSTSRRRFSLACPDVLAPMLPGLLASLEAAPDVTVEIVARRGEGALHAADVVLDVLPDSAPGVAARPLGWTHAMVAMRRSHPAAGEPLTLDAWLAWPHVMVRFGTGTPSLVDLALAPLGRERRVGLVVPNLLAVPHVVSRTNHLFTGAVQLIEPLLEPLDLVLRPSPVVIPSVRTAAMWRERHTNDPGHRWFRERVVQVFSAAFTSEVCSRTS